MFSYLELNDFNEWTPFARKFIKGPIVAVRYDEEIRIEIPLISKLTNTHLVVPFKFSHFTLDRLAHKIDKVKIDEVAPVDILDLDFMGARRKTLVKIDFGQTLKNLDVEMRQSFL